MRSSKILAALGIAAAVLLTVPVANAETRLALDGARPLGEPLNSILGGLTEAEYAELTPQVGSKWFPGTSPVVVDYPATAGPLWGLDAPTADASVAAGRANLHAAIMAATATGEHVVVAALSMGTIVVDQELAFLAGELYAPAADKLTFALFASPSRGVASLPPPGLTLPFFGFTSRAIPVSQYDVDVVFTQYDAWADFPDRPWNVIAVSNAVMSFFTRPELHTPTALVDRSQAEVLSSVTSTMGGTTTTYMVPTAELPITDPLRLFGVPEWATDAIDTILRPIVDSGYSRNDTGPIRLPYISQGRLVVPGLAFAETSSDDEVATTSSRVFRADAGTSAVADSTSPGQSLPASRRAAASRQTVTSTSAAARPDDAPRPRR